MIVVGNGTLYVDGVKIGEVTNAYAGISSEVLSNHFKSVKLHGRELIDSTERG